MSRHHEHLPDFIARVCAEDPKSLVTSLASTESLTIEILSGCPECGRRLLEAGDIVKQGVTVLDVRDDQTNETLAKYAVCANCAKVLSK